MKRLLILSSLILMVNAASGQRSVDRDPTYSVHNYKHPNKAAYAKKHHLDRSIELENTVVIGNANYKQHSNSSVASTKAVISVNKPDKSRKSYKHPLGL
jgi:hypothetical protein